MGKLPEWAFAAKGITSEYAVARSELRIAPGNSWLNPWRLMGRNVDNPQQPFANEPLEASLVRETSARPIRRVHAAATVRNARR